MAAKLLLLMIVAAFGSASALVMSPIGARSPVTRVAASPSMACNGGKGGRGGKSPPKDKARRGKVRRLVWVVRAFLTPFSNAADWRFCVAYALTPILLVLLRRPTHPSW